MLIPEQFTLSGPEARQSLVVERYAGRSAVGQVADGVNSLPATAKS